MNKCFRKVQIKKRKPPKCVFVCKKKVKKKAKKKVIKRVIKKVIKKVIKIKPKPSKCVCVCKHKEKKEKRKHCKCVEDKCTHDLWKQLHKLIGKEIAVLTTADNEVSGKLVEVTHGSISIFEPHHGALIIPLCNIVLYTHEESDRRQVKP